MTPQANADIRLAREMARLTGGPAALDVPVDVTLRLLPRPRVVIEAVSDEHLGAALSRGFGQTLTGFEFPNRRFDTQCVITSLSASDSAYLSAIPRREPLITTTDHSNRLVSTLFHIFNFVDFIGGRIGQRHPDGSIDMRETLIFDADGWSATIMTHRDTASLIKQLKATGGYAITHVGELTRSDGSPFTYGEADTQLDIITRFLAFARGAWAPAVLPIGYDDTGRVAWESWGGGRIDPWTSPLSWFDPIELESAARCYASFNAKLQNEMWAGPIKTALHWYLKSNVIQGGHDVGIILSQAALELLAWVHLVEDTQSFSASSFRKVPASDKLRLMLSRLGIPLPLPSNLPEVARYAPQRADGPEAFTHVRNSLVHPGPRQQASTRNAHLMFEAWRLGQWFLELALLAICGYTGPYSNRLNLPAMSGKTEPVPWSVPDSN